MVRLASRRDVLAGTATAAIAAIFTGGAFIRADDETLPQGSAQYRDALKKVLGLAVPEERGVTVDLPDDAENGNIVPYKLEVESPMTEADHITRLHLLSTANPQASVATFHFTRHSGKAAVAGRMRLAKTQDVVAVAVTSAGKFLIGKRNVKVTIGGCGVE
jgi:sulfur-oxidizing protein SoxY